MPDLKGSKTHDNLKEAFVGESQANRRYLYFAQKADVEGFPDVAALFRSVAEGETATVRALRLPRRGRRPGHRSRGRRDHQQPPVRGHRRDLRVHGDVPGLRAARPPTRASRRSRSGSRRSPAPRRATPDVSRPASRTFPDGNEIIGNDTLTECGPGHRPGAVLTNGGTAMRKLTVDDILDQFARTSASVSDSDREIIDLKMLRRVPLGPIMTMVFENATTMRWQIQEMARAERMLRDEQIAHEVETYNQLIPDAGELSATLMIELTSEPTLASGCRLVGIQHHIAVVLPDGRACSACPPRRTSCGSPATTSPRPSTS